MNDALHKVTAFLVSQLDSYLRLLDTSANSAIALLRNIATVETGTSEEGVYVTLIKIEEETGRKNRPDFKVETGGRTFYKNPPFNVNLYIIFTAYYNDSRYETGLLQISRVLEFFQNRLIFTNKTTFSDEDTFRINAKLFSPSFEQNNYIWGSLGGKQYPYTIFKFSVIQVEDRLITEEGTPITNIEINAGNTLE